MKFHQLFDFFVYNLFSPSQAGDDIGSRNLRVAETSEAYARKFAMVILYNRLERSPTKLNAIQERSSG